jgi:hypothetical protein
VLTVIRNTLNYLLPLARGSTQGMDVLGVQTQYILFLSCKFIGLCPCSKLSCKHKVVSRRSRFFEFLVVHSNHPRKSRITYLSKVSDGARAEARSAIMSRSILLMHLTLASLA